MAISCYRRHVDLLDQSDEEEGEERMERMKGKWLYIHIPQHGTLVGGSASQGQVSCMMRK